MIFPKATIYAKTVIYSNVFGKERGTEMTAAPVKEAQGKKSALKRMKEAEKKLV